MLAVFSANVVIDVIKRQRAQAQPCSGFHRVYIVVKYCTIEVGTKLKTSQQK